MRAQSNESRSSVLTHILDALIYKVENNEVN